MAAITALNLAVVLILLLPQRTVGQTIDGCPMYGCRPSGTFSYSLDIPKDNVTIGWVSNFFLGPVPDYGGCVGNPSNIVCQSNGPAGPDTGYMSIDAEKGTVRWRDPVLRFPTLPVLDDSGTIWGSDGSTLMSYDVDGKPQQSNTPLDPTLRPIFGTQYVGSGIVLVVSQNGELATWLPDGTPLASLFLNGTVERSNGTFLPVAPAVVNGNRCYVLTEFSPDDDQANLGLQRLYAIDIQQSMSERMTIAWYANFERESTNKAKDRKLRFQPKMRSRVRSLLRDPARPKPSILFDKLINTVYVALPPPITSYLRQEAGDYSLIGIKDIGNATEMVFKVLHSVTNMVLYERNILSLDSASESDAASCSVSDPGSTAGDQLWVSLPDSKLLAIDRLGNISKTIDVSAILKSDVTITSKMTTARAREADEDFLVFGIHVASPTEEFTNLAKLYGNDVSNDTPNNYVIGIDTPENIADEDGDIEMEVGSRVWPISFMVTTPDDTTVFGQVVGIPGDGDKRKDMLLAFAQTGDKFAKLFTLQVV